MLRLKPEKLRLTVPVEAEDEAVALANDPNFFDAYKDLLKKQTTLKHWRDASKVKVNNFFYISIRLLKYYINYLATESKEASLKAAVPARALFMCQMYAEAFPDSLARQAETFAVDENFQYHLLRDAISPDIFSPDDVPPGISSAEDIPLSLAHTYNPLIGAWRCMFGRQAEQLSSVLEYIPVDIAHQYNPLIGVWRSAFIRQAEQPADAPIYTSLYALAKIFRGMGWGREVGLDLNSLAVHIEASSPEVSDALGRTSPEKLSALLPRFLENLVAGAEMDRRRMFERAAVEEHLPLPLVEITARYIGFFSSPRVEPPPVVAPSVSRCVLS